ncbi:hypothetical protein 1 [Changjiang tombus-like virus 21]|uniref:hypothetical protein 1 n=1 Tax=Changjiang tombus-like virus 21 TaxID=1922815 RepID=UPI00090C4A11|nr:hypothetical protein 1 [Changjiang tombus-like virus 21]APG76217.1 hypothetical protein 1 [Changjiang tombus-like virus 21]
MHASPLYMSMSVSKTPVYGSGYKNGIVADFFFPAGYTATGDTTTQQCFVSYELLMQLYNQNYLNHIFERSMVYKKLINVASNCGTMNIDRSYDLKYDLVNNTINAAIMKYDSLVFNYAETDFQSHPPNTESSSVGTESRMPLCQNSLTQKMMSSVESTARNCVHSTRALSAFLPDVILKGTASLYQIASGSPMYLVAWRNASLLKLPTFLMNPYWILPDLLITGVVQHLNHYYPTKFYQLKSGYSNQIIAVQDKQNFLGAIITTKNLVLNSATVILALRLLLNTKPIWNTNGRV